MKELCARLALVLTELLERTTKDRSFELHYLSNIQYLAKIFSILAGLNQNTRNGSDGRSHSFISNSVSQIKIIADLPVNFRQRSPIIIFIGRAVALPAEEK